MGKIICDNDCDHCDLEHWLSIKTSGAMVFGSRIRLRDCFKVKEDEEL